MIAIASDHAGYEYKEKIKSLLKELGHEYCDLGPSTIDTVDYPDYAAATAQAISSGKCSLGILVCGTGIGMSMAANKHRGIRAAVCESATAARLSRAHNDANILALGGRVVGWEVAMDIVKTFLSTSFDGGDRHQRRIIKIDAPLKPSL